MLRSSREPRPRLVVREEPISGFHYALSGGVVAVLLFAPLAFGAVQEWAFAVVEVAATLLFVTWLWNQTRSNKLEIVRSPLYLPIAGFAVLALIQLIFRTTAYPYATWTETLKYAAYGLVFFVTLQSFRSDRQVRYFAWTVSAFGFLLALFAILQQFTGGGKIYWVKSIQYGWIYGPYVNHNHYAGIMELLVPMPLALSLSNRIEAPKRVMLGFAAVIMASTIFLSGSRSGMVAFLVEAIFFAAVLFAQRKGRRPALLLAAALVVTFGLIAWIGGSEIASRIGKIHEHLRAEEATGRVQILKDGIGMARARPITGWGLGAFPIVYPHFRSFYTDLFVNEAHNDYLQVLIEMGVPGFALVVWFLIALYRRGMHRLPSESRMSVSLRLAALAACTGILAHSFTDFNLHIPANAAWYFVMCALATRPAQESKNKKRNEIASC